ncbi:MAG TPA: BatD family protein [Mucilaginibacter sp.]
MKKQFFTFILVPLVLLSGFCLTARAQNTQVEAKIDQPTIRIGDQTKLHLSVHQPAKEHVNFPKLADTVVGKVQIVGTNKPDTTVNKNDPENIIVNQSYTITCFDAGTYTIPSFAFSTSGGVLKTNDLTLQVVTVKVDTAKAIYDIKQPLTVSYTFFDWLRDNWYWVVLPLLGVLFMIWLVRYLKNRTAKQPVIEVIKPGLPPSDIALNRLKELRDKKLWQQDKVKQYHSDLTDIIRDYLEKRYLIKTHEKTTGEIFEGLKYLDITVENKNMLRQILVLADLVKFAKEKPLPADNEQSMDNAINFVLKTQSAVLPVNTEGGSEHV